MSPAPAGTDEPAAPTSVGFGFCVPSRDDLRSGGQGARGVTDLAVPFAAALADRYVIERELGAGRHGHRLPRPRPQARPRGRAQGAQARARRVLGGERFLAEIQLTAKLDHPHILTLIDSGEADGFLYYVLPFVRGESLRDRLSREKQLGVEEALAIAHQVASALDYAHRAGRDPPRHQAREHPAPRGRGDAGRLRHRARGEGGGRQPADRDRPLARHAAVHEPRAGDRRSRARRRGATSTRSAPCCTRCSPASRRIRGPRRRR